ncbi:uncharacterized protein LOC105664694 isoform X2 [Ceratitis capitata]|uniref:uncharacterized protein LOC105664694 isoform X2 n=1 Tax=Ceratitis capitata TaxID=7213 RepID=UPI0006188C33|nr:uncharacterized protein LOC105664694 isoform X2 [Ceratitis capitata]
MFRTVIPIVIWLLLLQYQCHAEQKTTTDCSKLPKSICFVECLFNRSGICHQGKCSYQRAIDYLDSEFALQQSAFKDIYKRAFKKCIAKANDVLGNMVKRFSRHGCHPLPEIIRFCIRNEMFTSCPNGYWNERVPGCSKKRDFIRNCIKDN